MKKKMMVALCCMTMAMGLLTGCTSGTANDTQASSTTEEVEATDSTTSEETESAESENTESEGDEVYGSMEGVKVKIGTSGTFGPFSYYDEDGATLIGYDMDMLAAIQEILGFEIDGEIQAMDYSALTTSVAEGKLDIVAAGLCATDERREVMNFTESYFDSSLSAVVNTSTNTDITGVDSLAGKTIAVEKGTEANMYATENLTDSNLQVFDNITMAYEALEQGKVDALIELTSGCAFYLKTAENSGLEIVGDAFDVGETTYAIALNSEFGYVEEFDAALAILTENGTMDELYTKWCE